MADGTGNGTDGLCEALYGRPAEMPDWVNGGDARMLHDAAIEIDRLRQENERLKSELSEIRRSERLNLQTVLAYEAGQQSACTCRRKPDGVPTEPGCYVLYNPCCGLMACIVYEVILGLLYCRCVSRENAIEMVPVKTVSGTWYGPFPSRKGVRDE